MRGIPCTSSCINKEALLFERSTPFVGKSRLIENFHIFCRCGSGANAVDNAFAKMRSARGVCRINV